MMRRTLFGAAVAAFLLVLSTPRQAHAQGFASLVAAAAAGSSMTAEKQPTCFTCDMVLATSICKSGATGHGTCKVSFANRCNFTQPGCGQSASLPLDPDGAAQYVSSGSLLGVAVAYREGDGAVKRNCEGVVVARRQSPDDIQSVRNRTGTLSL